MQLEIEIAAALITTGCLSNNKIPAKLVTCTPYK